MGDTEVTSRTGIRADRRKQLRANRTNQGGMKAAANILAEMENRDAERLRYSESGKARSPISRWTRILGGSRIVVLTGGTCLWFFGTQAFFVLEARNVVRKHPFVKNAPAELTDLSISQAPGMKLSYFGY